MHELDPLPKERSISGSIGHNNRPCSIHGVLPESFGKLRSLGPTSGTSCPTIGPDARPTIGQDVPEVGPEDLSLPKDSGRTPCMLHGLLLWPMEPEMERSLGKGSNSCMAGHAPNLIR